MVGEVRGDDVIRSGKGLPKEVASGTLASRAASVGELLLEGGAN